MLTATAAACLHCIYLLHMHYQAGHKALALALCPAVLALLEKDTHAVYSALQLLCMHL